MNLFQLLTLPIVSVLFVYSIVVLIRGKQPRSIALLGSLIWLIAGIAILKPELTMRFAAFMGIGRGADLLLYLLVISYLISLFYIYTRFRKMESDITKIVRQIAIRDYRQFSVQTEFEDHENK